MIVQNGIKVKIVVGEADIAEYLVEKDLAQNRVTCWVPSQTGKEFAIIVTNDRRDGCLVKVKADGTNVYEPIMECFTTRNVAFYRESRLVKRPFIFAKLDLVDDDDLLNAAEVHLGEIEVACWNFGSVEICKDPYFNPFPENKKVHERSKKGIGQHIGLGKAISSQQQCSIVHAKETDHVVTFVFRYRPIDYLQAQGIAPLDPPQQGTTPAADAALDEHGSRPEESVPDGRQPGMVVKEEYIEISDGEDDEISALLAKAEQMRAKAEEMKAQKRKKKEVQAPRKKVKKEEALPTFVPGQIIDLT